MPLASSGNVISSSAQLGADVVTSAKILNDEIVNADIKTTAAIAGSKLQALSVGANAGVIPSTGIVDAHIAAAAGIVDTKLAEIGTANKLNGTAFKNLAGIPAGAGVIPAANLPATSVTYKNGKTTKNCADASTTQNIAHGLGAIPKNIRLKFVISLGVASWKDPIYAEFVYNGTTASGFSFYSVSAGSSMDVSLVASLRLNASATGGVASYSEGVITFDATNIIITWTLNGSPTGTYTILWDAEV